jgi:type VI protein secretion system component VasK
MHVDSSTGLSHAGAPALIVLGIVFLIELAILVWGLYDIWARRRARSQPWLWTALLVVLNWIGLIVYLAAGRRPKETRRSDGPQDGARPPAEDEEMRARHAENAIDTLYGGKKE